MIIILNGVQDQDFEQSVNKIIRIKLIHIHDSEQYHHSKSLSFSAKMVSAPIFCAFCPFSRCYKPLLQISEGIYCHFLTDNVIEHHIL